MIQAIIPIRDFDFSKLNLPSTQKEEYSYEGVDFNETIRYIKKIRASIWELHPLEIIVLRFFWAEMLDEHKKEEFIKACESLTLGGVPDGIKWGIYMDSELKSKYKVELTVLPHKFEKKSDTDKNLSAQEFDPIETVTISENLRFIGDKVEIDGREYVPMSKMSIDGTTFSVGHPKGELYNFGVFDHTNGHVVLPMIFNHIQLGINTIPSIATVNYNGRWYAIEFLRRSFVENEIDSLSIVDPRRYSFIDGFDTGLARVRIGDLWGIINTEGEEVVPVEYQNIWNFYDKFRMDTSAEKNGRIEQIVFKNLIAQETTDLKYLPKLPKLNCIGMQNFRRFQNKENINFKDINFFVGPNNAGKSTSIKALILLSSNLNNLHFDFPTKPGLITMPFNFAVQNYPELNVGSYSNAINRNVEDESILLEASVGLCDFKIAVGSDSIIKRLEIISQWTNLVLIIDSVYACIMNRPENIVLAKKEIKAIGNITSDLYGPDLIKSIIEELRNFLPHVNDDIDHKLQCFNDSIQESINALKLIKHIPVYSASRNAILNSYDATDLTAIAAVNFINKSDYSKEIVERLLHKWMDENHFNIGKDFKVLNLKERNTLLTIEIQGFDNKWEDLCDIGTGVNHLFTLLLTLGCLIEKYAGNTSVRPIIAIEEPEMNLHPKLQCLLSNLFYDVNNIVRDLAKKRLQESYLISNNVIADYGFQFMIETHSEYVIRRAQRIIAEKKYTEEDCNKIPFSIYFFPSDRSPYDMGWNKFGQFQNCFDDGFFNVSSNDAIAVAKLERYRQ